MSCSGNCVGARTSGARRTGARCRRTSARPRASGSSWPAACHGCPRTRSTCCRRPPWRGRSARRTSWPRRRNFLPTGSLTPSTVRRSPACSGGSGMTPTATPSATRSCGRPSTANCCAAAGCATTTGSRTRLERVHADAHDSYLNELAHHFSMGAALGDGDKAVRYCRAAGERALRLLAFEEAVSHLTRGLEVAERHCAHDQATRCDLLLALAEAQSRAGDAGPAEKNFDRATSLARAMGDGERLAASAVRRGPLSYLLGSRGPTPRRGRTAQRGARPPARGRLPPARHGDRAPRLRVAARAGHPAARRHHAGTRPEQRGGGHGPASR